MALIYMPYVALIFFWCIRLIVIGEYSVKKGFGLYVFFVASPVVLSGALFMSMLGYEMLTKNIVMSESFARELIFTTAMGAVTVLFSTIIFILVIYLRKLSSKRKI